MKFDYEGARKAGYSDAEIAQYIASESGFDLDGALGAGYNHTEILSFLTAGEEKSTRQRLQQQTNDWQDQVGMDQNISEGSRNAADYAKRERVERQNAIARDLGKDIEGPVDQRDVLAAEAAQSRGVAGTLRDAAIQTVQGIKQIGASIPGLIAPDSEFAQSAQRGIRDTQSQLSGTTQASLELADAKIKAAAENGTMDELKTAVAEYASDPVLWQHFIATTMPSMLGVLAPAKAAQLVAAARGVSGAGLAAVGANAAGAANAVMNAGGARQEAYDSIYQALVESGVSEEQAREEAKNKSMVSAAVGGGMGWFGGRYGAESALLNGAQGLSRGGIIAGAQAAGGVLGREIATEQGEELLPQLVTNSYVSEIDGSNPLEGLPATAVQTAMAAGPMSMPGAVRTGREAYDPLGSELQGLPGEVERTQFSYADLARAQAQQAMDASAIMAKIGSAQSVDDAIAAASEAMAVPNTNLQETMNVAAQVAQGRAQEQGDLGAGGTGNNLDLRGLDGRGGPDAGASALGDRAGGVVGNAGLADPSLINQQNDLDNLENDLFGVTDAAQPQPLAQEATQANGQETGSQQTTAPASIRVADIIAGTNAAQGVVGNGQQPQSTGPRILDVSELPVADDGRGDIISRAEGEAVRDLAAAFGGQADIVLPGTESLQWDGVTWGNTNRISINARSKNAVAVTVAHEVGHVIENQGNEAWAAFESVVLDEAKHDLRTDEGLLKYAMDYAPSIFSSKEIHARRSRGESSTQILDALIPKIGAGYDRAAVRKEFAKDVFGNAMMSDGFMGRVASKLSKMDVPLLKTVIDTLTKAINVLRGNKNRSNFRVDQMIKNLERVRDAAATVAAKQIALSDNMAKRTVPELLMIAKRNPDADRRDAAQAELKRRETEQAYKDRDAQNEVSESVRKQQVLAGKRDEEFAQRGALEDQPQVGGQLAQAFGGATLDRQAQRRSAEKGAKRMAAGARQEAQARAGVLGDNEEGRYSMGRNQAPQETENREGVIVGARPGEFDWSFAKGGTPAPIQHPVQLAPRVEKLGPAVQKILSSKQAKQLFEDAFGVTGLQVMPTLGSYKGKPEPSFVMYGDGMTFDAADGMSRMLGFAFAQEATIVTQPVYSGDEDTWPAFYLSSGKKLTKQQIEKVREAAANEKLDYTTSVDMTAVKFFFDGSDLDAYQSKIVGIAKAAGLKNIDRVQTRSKFNEAANYLGGEAEGAGRQVWYQEGGSGSSSLFGRTVDHLLVPYAKAVGAEGYRFSPDLFADRFGLSPQQREYIRAALRPKNGAKLSTADIVAGRETLEVTKSDFRAKTPRSNNTDILWALQNRAAKNGQIEPGDYSDDAKKAISQALADEVVEHISRPGGKSAIGWYDAALKRAKEIYDRVFPELNTNKDREMLFDALLGIASQGNDVHSNSVFAGRMYHLITREGMTISQAVDALYGTFGGETRAIENNFLKFEALIDRNGYDRMRQLFNKKMTVGEWNALLRRDETLFYKGEPLKVEGAARQKVNGWMVFGPKIGSFINNLHGDYSTLTADLWFSRTWNRVLGFSFLHTPQQEADKYQSFKEALIAEHTKTTEPKGFDRVGKPIAWEHGEDINFTDAELDAILADPDEMLALANELNDWYKKGFTFSHDPKDKKGGYSTKSSLRRAAKTWIEHRQDSVAAPRNDNERAFQQETVEAAQKIIRRKTGEDISIADIQAALWYHEKELFQMFGAGDKKAEPADYADAAQNFMDRYDNGDLFYVEKPSPRYIRGKKGDYLDGNQGQRFSPRRSDVAGDERAGGSDAEPGSGVDLPEYGQAAPGAVSAVGRHYSAQQRSSLDGRYYGTGANGREAERVRASRDPRIKERIYFYVNSGKGITPEQGVGSHAHDIRLNNLYDANADTWLQARVDRGITDRNEWLNAFESAILDNGFDGYVSDFGTQRAAVLLGRHNVKPSYVGVNPTKTPGKAETQATKPKAQTNADADKVASARALPLGQMTGADWKRIVPLVVPDVDVSMLDDAKTYYKDDVVSAMRAGQARMSPSRAAPSRDVINQAVDDDFTGIVARMKKAGVLKVECS